MTDGVSSTKRRAICTWEFAGRQGFSAMREAGGEARTSVGQQLRGRMLTPNRTKSKPGASVRVHGEAGLVEAGSHTCAKPLSRAVSLGMVATSDSPNTFPKYATYSARFEEVRLIHK